MKKILILILAIVTINITGCENDIKGKIDEKNSCVKTFCDEEYGVEYIRDYCMHQGGITIRLDEEGNVIHCKKGEDK